jgi:hypothetical protein
MIIESKVAGIPCSIEVDCCLVIAPNRCADSDWDYAGYTEISFSVLDRNGRPAPWLARKLTSADTARIEAQILEGVGNDDSL